MAHGHRIRAESENGGKHRKFKVNTNIFLFKQLNFIQKVHKKNLFLINKINFFPKIKGKILKSQIEVFIKSDSGIYLFTPYKNRYLLVVKLIKYKYITNTKKKI